MPGVISEAGRADSLAVWIMQPGDGVQSATGTTISPWINLQSRAGRDCSAADWFITTTRCINRQSSLAVFYGLRFFMSALVPPSASHAGNLWDEPRLFNVYCVAFFLLFCSCSLFLPFCLCIVCYQFRPLQVYLPELEYTEERQLTIYIVDLPYHCTFISCFFWSFFVVICFSLSLIVCLGGWCLNFCIISWFFLSVYSYVCLFVGTCFVSDVWYLYNWPYAL